MLAVIGLLSFLLLSSSLAAAQPLPPARFWGTLRIDGQDGLEGVRIVALIDGKECGQGTIVGRTPQIQGSLYAVDVISNGQESGCGEIGKQVTFMVAGREANQKGTWDNSKGFVRVDLTVGSDTGGAAPVPGGQTSPGPGRGEQPSAPGVSQTDDDDFPWWIIAVIAALGVLAAIVGGTAWMRTRRGTQV